MPEDITNTPAAPVAPEAPAAPAPEVDPGIADLPFEARVDAIKTGMREEQLAAAEAEAAQPPAAPTKKGDKAPAPGPAPVRGDVADASENDPVRAARKQRMAELDERIARERAKQADRRAARGEPEGVQPDDVRAEMERMRAQLAEYEGVFKDPMTFLRTAEKRGVSQRQLAEWIQQSMTDPVSIADARAKEHVTGAKAEIQSMLREMIGPIAQELTGLRQERESSLAQRAEHQAFGQLIDFAQGTEATNPLAHSYLQLRGPQAFYSKVMAAIPELPEGCGPQAILDRLEEQLEDAQVAQRRPPPQPAVKPRNGSRGHHALTNSQAASRTAIEEPAALEDMTFDERLATLKAQP